jgi:hypothetical protein
MVVNKFFILTILQATATIQKDGKSQQNQRTCRIKKIYMEQD